MAEQHAVMRDTVNHKDNEDQTSAASSPQSIKNSLCYILDNEVSTSKRTMTFDQLDELDEPTAAKRKRPLVFANTISSLLAPVASTVDEKEAQNTNVTTRPSKRKNRAKSKGVCWSHGGGTICSSDRCMTIAVSNGVCWAHGGGKRCMTLGCYRPAFERTGNLCPMHYNAGSPT
ncbi:unnamed protein product [Peronospora destructor]|uniref:WRKY19-like zinc finger domain-containing protein n=1 Tax=Peronospora destructor TaxID=86335 RepID=A0AAV0UEV2_9STRA|nr:unnamed protein product [Peronospora destructor]